MLVSYAIRVIRRVNKTGIFSFVLNMLGILIFLFYILWGFNYAREDFSERVGMVVVQPDEIFLYSELKRTDSILVELRTSLSEHDTVALPLTMLPKTFAETIKVSQEEILTHFGQPKFSGTKIRVLRPSGFLLRIKTAGVYFPFALEGHIDNGLHSIEKPFVYAHELAHANGFTDEGVCNFIGLLTCVNSEDKFIQYSGWIEYQGYLYRTLKRYHSSILEEQNYEMPVSVRKDLEAIILRLRKYPDIFPVFRDLFYNNYLKAQGVSAGLSSYSELIQLSHTYIKENGSLIIK